MLTTQEEKFIEEYKILCKKYRIYLFAAEVSPSTIIVGPILLDDIINEHVRGVIEESQHR